MLNNYVYAYTRTGVLYIQVEVHVYRRWHIEVITATKFTP